MTTMTLLFVYGSLKRGEPNHRHLAHARFVGTAQTAPFFELYDLGAYPGMTAGGFTSVVGELYEVDDETLAAIDRFEGHPGFYRRTPTPLTDGRIADTYLLTRPWRGARHLPSGSWTRGATASEA